MPSEMKWAIALAVGVGLIFLGWRVPLVLATLHVLICFLLVIVVLMQSGKAADLAGAFGGAGSQTAFGPRGAATILSKATTWCFIMFLLTTVTLTLRQSSQRPQGSSVLEKTNSSAPAPPASAPGGQSVPAAPPAAPAPSAPAKK